MTERGYRILFVCSLIMAIGSSSLADSKSRPRVTHGDNAMILEYAFEEPDIAKSKDGFDIVSIKGLETYREVGAPVIPVKPVEILVPPGMDIVDITSTAIRTDKLSDTYRLPHGKEAFSRTEGKPRTPSKPDPRIFEMRDLWPGTYHRLLTVQTNRGYRIAYINLFPLQYLPSAGRLEWAGKLRLDIRFSRLDRPLVVRSTGSLELRLERRVDNPDTLKIYDAVSAKHDANSGLGSGGKDSTSPLGDPECPYYEANYKYIVITSDALAGVRNQSYSFQALCDSKTARGIPAGIVTTDWIYATYDGTKPAGGSDNQTKLRSFLADAYETWGTEYALLGGDKDIIPIRNFYDGRYPVPCDMYYGCVDPPACTFDHDRDGKYGERKDGPDGGEVDLTAEIFTGRAAVEDASEVINFVRKTLVYESIDDPYLNVAGAMGSYLGFGGIQEFTKPFGELIRLGSDLYLGHFTHGLESPGIPHARDFTIMTLYDEDWWNDHHDPDFNHQGGVNWDWDRHGWSATDDLLPVLNGEDGNTTPHLLYISDHGSPEWGMVKLKTTPTTYYNCDDLSKLRNTRPFFFYDDSCEVGAFDHADCFGEEITTMEHGAFATILNSRDGLGSEEDNLDSPSTQFTREFFECVLGEGIFELGRAHQKAKENNLWRMNTGFLWIRYVYYELNLFGDPEVRLRVTTMPDIEDCNGNQIPDARDIADANSLDVNGNDIPDECEIQFIRGDANVDGVVDVSDAIRILIYLFSQEGATPDCLNSTDSNDDSTVDISDVIYLLHYLFLNSTEALTPYPHCGLDSTHNPLGCDSFEKCGHSD